jgi:hypothetical protein
MPLLQGEIGRREGGRVMVRGEPVRLRWSFDDLVSSDGHEIQGVFSCSVRALEADADRRMLEEVFLAVRQAISGDAVIAHFHNPLRTAAASACEKKTAADLLAPNGEAPAVDALKAAANKVAFACGLEVLPPFSLDLESPTFERQRVETLQRTLAEQRAAGQIEHFNKAADLLKQFQSLRQQSPDLSAGDILRQLNPADQGAVLQTLILASAKEKTTQTLWAVAGPNLVRIDPSQSPPKTIVSPLPPTLGPLRSVGHAGSDGMLLVGARSGVFQVNSGDAANAVAFADSSITSQLGFSRAVLWNNQVFACHSEAGVVGWKLEEPGQPAFVLRPADLMGAAPKNLVALDASRLVFSTGNRLVVLSRGGGDDQRPTATPIATTAPSEIMAILPERHRIILPLRDGTVQTRDAKTLDILSQEKRCGEICSAALLPWLGSTRLLLATEEGPVMCVGLDDDVVTQFLSPHRGLRSLAAAADLIVAISADRQRIIWWQSWNSKQIAGDVYIAGLARHRAADVALGA